MGRMESLEDHGYENEAKRDIIKVLDSKRKIHMKMPGLNDRW